MSPPLGVYFSPPYRVGTHLITVHFAQLSTGDPYLKTLKTLKALGRLKAFIHEGLQDYMTTFSHHEGDIFSPLGDFIMYSRLMVRKGQAL